MTQHVGRAPWDAACASTGLQLVARQEGESAPIGPQIVIRERVCIVSGRPGDRHHGRSVTIDRTPDEAREYAWRLLKWVAEADRRSRS